MEKNRLICIRVPLEVLEQLDKMSSTAGYLNRSRIINSILEAVVKCCPGDEVTLSVSELFRSGGYDLTKSVGVLALL